MLSFRPLSTVPLSTVYTIVGPTIKVPVEILSTIRTVIEQIDMPVEIIGAKNVAGVQKWVLSSRGKQWVLSNRQKEWILSNIEKQWILSDRDKQWVLDSRASTWTIK